MHISLNSISFSYGSFVENYKSIGPPSSKTNINRMHFKKIKFCEGFLDNLSMDLDNLDLLEFVDCGFFVQNGAEPISINLQHTNIKKVVIRVGGKWLFYIKDRFIQIHCQGSLDSHAHMYIFNDLVSHSLLKVKLNTILQFNKNH